MWSVSDRHPGIKSPRWDPNAEPFLRQIGKIQPGTVFGKELVEWTLWYTQNKRRVSDENLKLRCDFQEKAIDGLLVLVALLAREVRPQLTRSTRLWLPSGMEKSGSNGRSEFFG